MDAIPALVDALREASGDNLASLVLTHANRDGSPHRLATLTVVLRDTSAAKLAPLREPLREAARQTRLAPYVLGEGELAEMLDTSPLKALHTRINGEVLHGEGNPFDGLPVDAEHLRIRLEQEARNLLVRLRHDVVMSPPDGHMLLAGMWRTVRGVERILEGLAWLRHGQDALPEAIWATATADWDLPADGVAALIAFAASSPAGDVEPAATSALTVLEALVARTDKLKG